MIFLFFWQGSNVDFLCDHKFDFNKVRDQIPPHPLQMPSSAFAFQLFYEGIHYLNSQQETQLRGKDGLELSEE